MGMAADIFLLLLILSALAYLVVVSMLTNGWNRIKETDFEEDEPVSTVSVVVAMRNEENNIMALLEDIYQQDYPHELTEVILVDDHSDDQTKALIGRFRREKGIRNIILEKSPLKGKKAAVAQGIKLAHSELILTTDADCRLPSKWISKMVAFYRKGSLKLVLGPVIYNKEKGVLEKLFSLDFISLVASGAGAAGSGKPFLGNGANMAFNRFAYLKVSEKLTGEQYASGDDVFLVQAFQREFGGEKMAFLKDHAAIVKTAPPKGLPSFLRQRIRWASKAKAYRSSWPVTVSLVVAFFNTMLTLSFLVGWFQPGFFFVLLFFLTLKTLVDLPLLIGFTRFADKKYLREYILPLELIYPFYITFVSVLSLFLRYEWKGRKVS
jgi:cellulose synthase/poly-beta-1,6-N-acetylglucosamine synthase-like glycosyltransferase